MVLLEVPTAILWLALNIYHEGRGEDPFAQVAIAHVTLNRSYERGISIKEVVKQPYQFSWVKQKDNHIPNDWGAFQQCIESARVAVHGFDYTFGATYFHLKTQIPEWTNRVEFVGAFGAHYFYREKRK